MWMEGQESLELMDYQGLWVTLECPVLGECLEEELRGQSLVLVERTELTD